MSMQQGKNDFSLKLALGGGAIECGSAGIDRR